jgi:mono/diheme cytochrome c family protein
MGAKTAALAAWTLVSAAAIGCDGRVSVGSDYSAAGAGSGTIGSGGSSGTVASSLSGGSGAPATSGGLGAITTLPPRTGGSTVAIDAGASAVETTETDTKIPGKTYTDLPAAPILDAPGAVATPANAAGLFAAASPSAQMGSPCLIEPETGALYPRNWLRPSFRWIVPTGENLFEVRLHVGNQANDLLVYTTQNVWTLPKDLWTALDQDSYDEPMTVTVRGGALGGDALLGVSAPSTATMSIAPVPAPGSVVYWTTTSTTALKGFRIGDENVEPVLAPAQVQQPGGTNCVGCHTATPDGDYASFCILGGGPDWANTLANIQPGQTGMAPPWLGAGASAFLASNAFGINSFSPAHWVPGDRIEISMYQEQSELVWIDLEAAQSTEAWGKIALNGDPQQTSGGAAGAPAWSHDGNTIAYVSLAQSTTGRLLYGPADIYTVPYNDKKGGTAMPVAGASDPAVNEYYPAFSPDDSYLVFTKTADVTDATGKPVTMYDNADAEVEVVPAAGGTATRFVANDPPSCTMQESPGVTNSWPKTAPNVGIALDGRRFYWVIFSSRRDPFAMKNPQLYVTAFVVDAAGTMTTYSALYLWNQPEAEANHTPSWDNFGIQYIPPTVIGPR